MILILCIFKYQIYLMPENDFFILSKFIFAYQRFVFKVALNLIVEQQENDFAVEYTGFNLFVFTKLVC